MKDGAEPPSHDSTLAWVQYTVDEYFRSSLLHKVPAWRARPDPKAAPNNWPAAHVQNCQTPHHWQAVRTWPAEHQER